MPKDLTTFKKLSNLCSNLRHAKRFDNFLKVVKSRFKSTSFQNDLTTFKKLSNLGSNLRHSKTIWQLSKSCQI